MVIGIRRSEPRDHLRLDPPPPLKVLESKLPSCSEETHTPDQRLMPRLSPPFILRAQRIDWLLPVLLRTCRDLQSACNELRWLREHAISLSQQRGSGHGWRARLKSYCIDRGRGKPLQYILGDQPFGDLNILCRPGVLIPRPETEAHTKHLAKLISGNVDKLPSLSIDHDDTARKLRILDLCTGTGCISLLLHNLLKKDIVGLDITGIDLSKDAVRLARENADLICSHSAVTGTRFSDRSSSLTRCTATKPNFFVGDVFSAYVTAPSDGMALKDQVLLDDGIQDILISNPPYVSPKGWNTDTSHSVRKWEPKSALVPVQPRTYQNIDTGDIFYPRLLQIARQKGAQVVLLEVADVDQATRVASMAEKESIWEGIEIWRDWPDETLSPEITEEAKEVQINGRTVAIRGVGHGRSVLCWRHDGAHWVGRDRMRDI
ncbi:MAG: hypothetical protein M1827_003597 [Pycnora praestabilis]|nr:MAG: hypothetical protein M1827_003597 [Pycnora praestabilis]